jgi:hypothetical protein
MPASLSMPGSTTGSTIGSATAVSSSQQQYMQLVNEYQLAEIQRMIAEDNAAIAQSRYDAAQSMVKMAELTGDANPGAMGLGASVDNQSANSTDYELIYTGEDNNQWTATIKKNGQFNDVTAGSVLPDGTKILSVDDNGVVIQQADNTKKLVTFNGVTPFVDNTNNSATPAPATPIPATPVPAALLPPAKPVVKPVANPVTTNPVIKPVANPATNKTTAVSSMPPSTAVKPAAVTAVKLKPAEKNTPIIILAPNAIMSANKNAYTIQMIADNNFASVNDFITANQLQNKATVVKTVRRNKPWYIAVYGQYDTFAAANQAIQQLPRQLRTQGPFVRRIGDVQASVAN